ncbi:partner and localizer of BRCA2 isoform X3 [Varanus komodoensis]|uniref:partner and localizer of BRCA2 isoform X3 n=1 Tax=Varanus komodoensis TaxID=61221 RepID=UPI001CF7E4E3|nr:partner and localizer of BRCA2 isoform X3 [Varanus komodoensis]
MDSDVPKTVAEQNLPRRQEITEEDGAFLRGCERTKLLEPTFGTLGSISQTSPESLKYAPASICAENTLETAPVILEPEVTGQECSLPKNSGFKSNSGHVSQKGLCSLAGPVLEQNQLLSKTKTKTCTKPTETEREFVCEALQRTPGFQLEHSMESVKTPGSPVFKRRSFILETERSIPKVAVASFEGRGSNASFAMPSEEPDEETVFPEVSHPCAYVRVFSEEGIIAAFEDVTAENALSPTDTWNEGKESAQKVDEQTEMGREEPGRSEDLAGTREASQGGRAAPCMRRDEMQEERSQHKEAWNSDLIKRGSSTNKPGDKDSGEHLNPAAPAKTTLGSCTVVEGLLFPVEYYVRTTRQLSNCQREVNLEAVIQSQLGKRRKRRRTVPKEKNAKLAFPSREHVVSDELLGAVSFSTPGADGTSDTWHSLSQESTASVTGFSPSEGLLQWRKGQLRAGSNHRASSCTSHKTTVSKAQGKKKNCQGKGRAVALPARTGGHVGAQQSGSKRLGESVAECPGAASEAAQNAPADLVTASACSSPRGPQESCEACPESEPLGPAGDWDHTNARLGPAVQAALPRGELLAASLGGADGGPPHGGRVSSLHGEPEDPSQGLLKTSSAALHLRSRKTSDPKWLPPSMNPQGFHLPKDEFGCLKAEKLKLCAVKPLETFHADGPANCLHGVGELFAEGGNRGLLPGVKEPVMPPPPPLPQCLQMKGLPSSKLLLPPALEDVSSLLESQPPTPVFPTVGPTPASQASLHSEALLDAYPLQVNADTAGGLGSPADASLPRNSITKSWPQDQSGSWKPEEKRVSLAEAPVPAGESIEPSSKQSPCGTVDVSTVWWAGADGTELRVVTACETSVSLWRLLHAGRWEAACTWHFAQVPVTQIVPLPDVHNRVCVALGGLEVAEIRFLFHFAQDDSVGQWLVQAGNIKAVLGLKNRRLVSSCGWLQDQTVAVMSFSETGRSNERWALMSPEETILSFAEVEGMEEALVGMTTLNHVVIWNLRTGQLLRKMSIGYSGPACVCHKAYSSLGLLFVILSHPRAKENETCGNPAFQIIALNPKTAKNTGVLFLSLPPGIRGRYLEGGVRNTLAAAVLTSGTIAVWDLFLGQCTALLPPNPEGSWSLAKWSIADTCLLAGRKDGSVYIYSYTVCLSST